MTLAFSPDLYFWMYEDDLIKLVTKRLEDVGYSWNPKTFEMVRLPYALGDYKINLTLDDARLVLSKSDGTIDSETKQLLEYFWGTSINPQMSQSKTECIHDWVDVVLFNTVSQRCAHCDIKKPVENP